MNSDVATIRVIADRYRRVAGRFTEIVAAVSDDGWSDASPCAGWDARDVVRHNIDMATFVLGLNGLAVPEATPSVDEDPNRAWRAARDTVQAALDDPVLASRAHEAHRYLGVGPWNRSADRTLTTDLIVHTWDLARAAGLDTTIDPDDMRHWHQSFAEFDDATLRNPEVFGAVLEPPPGADDQTRFLAFLGRRAW